MLGSGASLASLCSVRVWGAGLNVVLEGRIGELAWAEGGGPGEAVLALGRLAHLPLVPGNVTEDVLTLRITFTVLRPGPSRRLWGHGEVQVAEGLGEEGGWMGFSVPFTANVGRLRLNRAHLLALTHSDARPIVRQQAPPGPGIILKQLTGSAPPHT